MTSHKILSEYTNKPESLNHLESEIDNYRINISDIVKEFNWNKKDKYKIKEEAQKIIKNRLKESHFQDVKFPAGEIDKFLDQSLNEFFGAY